MTPAATAELARLIVGDEFIPRKLKCAPCQVGDHCRGDDENCYCDCTAAKDVFSREVQ